MLQCRRVQGAQATARIMHESGAGGGAAGRGVRELWHEWCSSRCAAAVVAGGAGERVTTGPLRGNRTDPNTGFEAIISGSGEEYVLAG